MINMEDLDKRLLIEKIRSGKIKPEELSKIFKYFKSEDNRVKFELYHSIRKHGHLLNIPLLAEILNLPEKVVFQIFQSDYKISYFPIFFPAKNESKLAKLLVIELNNITEPIVFSSDPNLNTAVNTIKNITKKNFFVIFNENFEHNSFMLSLYSALEYPQQILDKYVFTGIIGNDGDIYDVEAVDEKRKAVEREGKKLISPNEIKDIKELNFWIGRSYIPVPFLQLARKNIDDALKDLETKIIEKENYFSLINLKNIYGLDKKDISLHSEDFLPFDEQFWTDYINKDFERKIFNILQKTQEKTAVFHIGVSISTLAFGLGVKFGCRQPCILYHFQRGKESSYFPVLDLEDSETLREIKEINHNVLNEMKYTNLNVYNEKADFSEVGVSLYLASHNLYADVRAFLRENKKNIPIIEISLKDNQGNLPINEDWKKYVIEINSIINELKDRKNINKINLFISVPAVIAFGLGMAIGHVVNIPVYSLVNKDNNPKEKYAKVFETVNISSPF